MCLPLSQEGDALAIIKFTSIPSEQTMELKAFRPALVAWSWTREGINKKGEWLSKHEQPQSSYTTGAYIYLWKGLQIPLSNLSP